MQNYPPQYKIEPRLWLGRIIVFQKFHISKKDLAIALAPIPLAFIFGQIHPILGMAPAVLMIAHILFKTLPLIKKQSGQRALAVTIVIAALFQVAPAHAAITFSILFASTENMIKTCITDQITGLSVLLFLVFAAIRFGFIWVVGSEALEGIRKNQARQNSDAEFQFVVKAAVAMIVIGVLEPLIVKSCAL